MAENHAHYRREAHKHHAAKVKHLGGYARGGRTSDDEEDHKIAAKAVHKHERHDHPGTPLTKLKEGGAVEGEKAHHRMDRPGRKHGGRNKHKGTNVNVIVAPGKDKPVPVPVPVGGPGAMPPHPPMAPPAAPPAPPPRPPVGGPPVAAGVPGMRKMGGRAYASGGKVDAKPLADGTHVSYKYRGGGGSGEISHVVKPAKTAANTMYAIKPDKASRHPGEPALIHRRGEHLHRASGGRASEMEAGAGGGEGRLEKIKDYGKDADVKEPGVKGTGHEAMKRGGKAR